MTKTVAVVGWGPSGIAALKNFVDAGFEVTGFELAQGVGGNWRFNDPTGHSSVFETTHIISSKHTSQYEDHPFPPDYPDYPSHRQLAAYFESYAARFDLNRRVRFNTRVLRCEPIDASGAVIPSTADLSKARWRIHSVARDAADPTLDQAQVDEFDALVVCNGHHHLPRMPSYPGEFKGELIHSHSFKRAAPFAGKRVLVIGGGNSACDCAVETSRVSARTDISWRRGYWLLPKFMMGKPTDSLPRQSWMPFWLQRKLFATLIHIVQGKNEDAGLPKPDHGIGETHPTVNSELYYFVRHGKVGPRPDIERFTGDDGGLQVKFKDGKTASYDAIIACTGYQIVHPFLDKSLVDFSSGPTPLYLKMLPEKIGNLYFIGLFQPLGCIWPGAELQSKLAAKHLSGRWSPKGVLSQLIAQENAKPDVQQIATARHTITVDDPVFRAKLRAQLT